MTKKIFLAMYSVNSYPLEFAHFYLQFRDRIYKSPLKLIVVGPLVKNHDGSNDGTGMYSIINTFNYMSILTT